MIYGNRRYIEVLVIMLNMLCWLASLKAHMMLLFIWRL